MNKYISITILVALILLLTLFFKNPLSAYFSQDDFFHFSLIWQEKLSSIPRLLLPGAQSNQFYRPISREVFNLIMYKLFGLNALAYHLVNFSLIFANSYLFVKILKKFTDNKFVYFFTLFLYLFSAVHSIELYYLSAVQTLFSTLFILSSFISYINFKNTSNKKYYIISIFLYLLGILSHESSAVLAGFIFVYELMLLKKIAISKIWQIFIKLLPFTVIVILRALISLFMLTLPDEYVYQPVFKIGPMLNTFVWFTLWNFGLPEMLTDFATLTLSFNPNLFKFYSYYTNTVFPLFTLIILSLFLMIITMFKSNLKDKRLWFFCICYSISLIPFLFFPNHKFVYYLTLPILLFSAFSGLILAKYWPLGLSHKFLIISFLLAYLAISYQTINLNKVTHWAAKRAASAEYIVKDIKDKLKSPEENAVIYIVNDPKYPFIANEWGTSSKQAFYILSGPDAFRLIFNNPTITTYYEDVTGPPKNIKAKKLHIYEAAFPY